MLAASLVLLTGVTLPENVPLPQARPDAAGDTLPTAEKLPEKPADVPVPQPKQAEPEAKPDADPDDATEEKPKEEEIPPIETENPAELAACLTELKTLGVEFKEAPRIDDGKGCGIDHPITVKSLGNQVALKPAGEMRCKTALQLSRWTSGSVIPALKLAMPEETLTALNQASAYICRKRNNAETGKISEHARGNAADIAGLTFKSGKTFSIEPRMKDSTLQGAFQRAITSAACLYFTTVLDPGSDAAHETHLHLDVIERKGGYRYCW